MESQGDEIPPDGTEPNQESLPARRFWRVLRIYLTILLGVFISFRSYARHSIIGCLIGGLVVVASAVLTYLPGSGFRHLFFCGES